MTPIALLASAEPPATAAVAPLPLAELSVAVLRRQLRDLAEAALAAVNAYDAGAPDPLDGLRDELADLGYPPLCSTTTDSTTPAPATEGS